MQTKPEESLKMSDFEKLCCFQRTCEYFIGIMYSCLFVQCDKMAVLLLWGFFRFSKLEIACIC